jgi:hypothetical protein
MKMGAALFRRLESAIDSLPAGASERDRWDSFWRACDAGLINCHDFYGAGLDDSHIDTALRRIVK